MKFNTIYQIYIDFKQFILKVKYEIALNNFTAMFYESAAIIIRHNARMGPFMLCSAHLSLCALRGRAAKPGIYRFIFVFERGSTLLSWRGPVCVRWDCWVSGLVQLQVAGSTWRTGWGGHMRGLNR